MVPKFVVGIDYSMSCPAITITKTDEPFSFEGCWCYYLTDKVVNKSLKNVTASRLCDTDYSSNEERFELISRWAINCLDGISLHTPIFIEDYSYGSKGKVFHIAENTGVLKHKIHMMRDFPITVVPPTVVKKFATGKGNATKDQMHAAFVKDTGVNLMKLYQPKAECVGSPVGDLVDSFYICKYGLTVVR